MPTLNGLIQDFVQGDDIDIERNIANVPTADSLSVAWLTVKERESDLDPNAVFPQKRITGTYVAGQGQITDSGATDNEADVRFELTAANTLLLTGDRVYVYDISVLTAAGKLYTPEKGKMIAKKQVTRATS